MGRLYILAVLLGTIIFTGFAKAAPEYPESYSRFIEYNIKGTSAYLLIDKKTGCEYIRVSVQSGYTLLEGSCKTK